MSELLPAHLLNGELGNVEEPRKVCFSYHSKLFDRVFGEVLRDKNSRIVHQQAALGDLRAEGVDRREIGDIQRECPSAFAYR